MNGKPEFTEFTLADQGKSGTLYFNNILKNDVDMRQAEGQYQLKEQHDAWDLWMGASVDNALPGGISLTVEESTRLATLMTDIESYTDENLVKFIMGVEPLERFDSYVEKIKGMKIDEAISIQQAALDRFNSR